MFASHLKQPQWGSSATGAQINCTHQGMQVQEPMVTTLHTGFLTAPAPSPSSSKYCIRMLSAISKEICAIREGHV